MSVDPLSDLLGFLQPECTVSGRMVAGGKWARKFNNVGAVKFCTIAEGECWYSLEGTDQAKQVFAGDILITSGTRALKLASSPSLLVGATATPLSKNSEHSFILGEGRDFVLVGGTVHIDENRKAMLLSSLPPLIHVRQSAVGAERFSWLLEQLVAEMEWRRPGSQLVVSSLAQLLFVETLRAYLLQADADDDGWLKAYGDQRLAIVLSCIHREPSKNWSLEELAKKAGMSRTSLAVRFRTMMGVPPLSYLTAWRMSLAKRELRTGASVSQVASAIGYSSESAFSGAFKRFTNVSPGKYQRSICEDANGQNMPLD